MRTIPVDFDSGVVTAFDGRELGREPAPPDLLRFADAEFEAAGSTERDPTDQAPARAAADALFGRVLDRFDR